MTSELFTHRTEPAGDTRPLESAFNFRDLGGLPTRNGSTLASGRLFRSDNLSRVTSRDLRLLQDLGIRQVIDLRTEAERSRSGTIADTGFEGTVHTIPLLDVSAAEEAVDPPDDYLIHRYRQILTEGAPGISRAVSMIASGLPHGSVFHCAVGKDRTGMIAMVILGLCDVPEEIIVKDYARTAPAMTEMLVWLSREMPEIAARVTEIPPVIMSAIPSTMVATLDFIDSAFGGFERYAAYAGISNEVIEKLREELVSS
ncbi:MAG: tyrosine-protein phosphatase [Acidimicrobiales bacterium]